MLVTEKLEILKAPITAQRPCGESARYSSEYERLQEEIDQLNSVDDVQPDWTAIEQCCFQLLSAHSKDLLLACYWTIATFRRHGYEELDAGLQLIRYYLTEYWEELFPEVKRTRGRLAALEWLDEQLQLVLPLNKPREGQNTVLQQCLSSYQQLQDTSSQCFGEQSPELVSSMGLLMHYVEDLNRQDKEKQRKQAQAQVRKDSGLMEINNEADLGKSIKCSMENLQIAAQFLLEQNPADERIYRYNRIACWQPMNSLPENNNGAVTVPSVAQGLLDKICKQLEEGKYLELITELEPKLIKAPLWIDGHYYIATALANLGEAFHAARRTLMAELSGFLRRFPELLQFRFSDGVSLAGEQCQQWLQMEVLIGLESGGAHQHQGGDAPWLEAGKEARQLSSQGRFNQAFSLFREGLANASGIREELYWQLEQANFCLDSGNYEVAIAQLDFLEKEIGVYRLEEFDPKLASAICEALLQCYNMMAEKRPSSVAAIVEKANRVYQKFCRLDVELALKLGEAKGLRRVLQKVYEK